jgi:NAD(P)-dependent dehydrogenase (short-subunit alcohol dehydrogenase family)
MSLKGRVALVTGGGGHIGQVLVEALLEVGAAVAITDLPVACERARHVWKQRGVDLQYYPGDLEDTDSVRHVPSKVVNDLGRLDILVHCAALVGTSTLRGWIGSFSEQSVETFRRALEVNLTSAFVLTQAAASDLARHGCGSVIYIASIYGMVGPDWRLYEGSPLGNPAAYAASKGGLIQFTRWLATTLAPKIRVNAVTPGGVYRQTPEPFHSRYCSRTPLQRMGTEEDLKGAVVYLASDLSAYVTGHNLVVDGGWTVW